MQHFQYHLRRSLQTNSHSVGCNLRKVKTDHLKDNSRITKEDMILKVMQGKNKRSFLFVLIRRGWLLLFTIDNILLPLPFVRYGGDCFPKKTDDSTIGLM